MLLQRAFRQMLWSPVASDVHDGIIRQREAELRFQTPKAVRELLVCEGFSERFREFSAGQEVIDNNLASDIEKLRSLGTTEDVSNGTLVVAVENQGVAVWAVRLNDGDDPPVYVGTDTYGTDEVDRTQVAESFSEWLFQMVSVG